MKPLPFNKPFMTGRELEYIRAAVDTGKISGNGLFTNKCHDFFRKRFGFLGPLLTTSCTDALEMAAIVAGIKPGDEVIMPSFTFVSTANAFVLRGARIVFADSAADNPNMDCASLEALVTPRTRAIVPVHYAGVACDMDGIDELAGRRGLLVIEDAAQAIDSYYRGRPLGSFGDFSAFSFHETKNVISGEGGMFVANRPEYLQKAEIAWEKGTNRSAFWRGEVDKYGWVDVGSSFLPSEVIAAFLYAQLEHLDEIQAKRRTLWDRYQAHLAPLAASGKLRLPTVPAYATNNAHMYYVVCRSLEERTGLIAHLKKDGIHAVFHYLSLHKSPFYGPLHDGRELRWSDFYTDCLVRLPMYYELEPVDVDRVAEAVTEFFAR